MGLGLTHAPWMQAQQTTAMHDVARHVADGVLKDCVDEIILEVWCQHLGVR